jgi:hypothetical protein
VVLENVLEVVSFENEIYTSTTITKYLFRTKVQVRIQELVYLRKDKLKYE